MKCVLCDYITNNKEELKKHYLQFHNVDENNLFFKKIIDQKKNIIHRKKCNFCNEFVFLNKNTHDFLKHYQKGLSAGLDVDVDADNNFDDKPVNITNVGDIKKIEITFKEHSSDYDFFDSVAVVDNFLAQVKNVTQRYDNDVLIRAGFSIENIQQALDNYSEPLVQTRYWSTEPIQTKSFNDFVLFKTRDSILKRVINNRLSGSAWSFNKFNYLNVKILKVSNNLMK